MKNTNKNVLVKKTEMLLAMFSHENKGLLFKELVKLLL